VGGLSGTVAVVTGASRGLGKGIALGLGEAGATVYVTGRSTRAEPGALPGTIDETADELTRLGGRGIAVPCDHREDAQVEALFARVREEEGQLDLLVNNAFGSPEQRLLWSGDRFWEVPVTLWDDLIDVGLRSHFIASRCAALTMIAQGHGLIVNVASHAAGRSKAAGARMIVPYSVCKAGLHRLYADMAAELREHGVGTVAVWPPGSRTEGVLAQSELFPNVAEWKEPIFTGRVVAALATAGVGLERSGEALVITDLAEELGLGT
jgi:NAD(P)-dependent dehydrogenase (short-subunit alcohol dehydrogenase family)